MDADRFESLLRSLSAAPSRRGALHLLASVVLGSILTRGVAGTGAHDARKRCKRTEDKGKRRKCLKKAKKHNAAHVVTCTPNCAGKQCGDDGCDGSCGTCGTLPCVAGTCDCTGQPDTTGCGGSRQCSGGVCATPPTCAGRNGTCTIDPEIDSECCSFSCSSSGSGCLCSQLNEECHTTADCCPNPSGLVCRGFRCFDTTP